MTARPLRQETQIRRLWIRKHDTCLIFATTLFQIHFCVVVLFVCVLPFSFCFLYCDCIESRFVFILCHCINMLQEPGSREQWTFGDKYSRTALELLCVRDAVNYTQTSRACC